jgi:hypothetical protein
VLDVAEPPLNLGVWVLHEVCDLSFGVVLHVPLWNAVVVRGRLSLVVPGGLFAPELLQAAKLFLWLFVAFLDQVQRVVFWFELADHESLFLRRGHHRRVCVGCRDEPNPDQGDYKCSSYELYG